MPEGMRMFERDFSVSGASIRIRALQKAIGLKSCEVAIEPEPRNKYDRNALKIVFVTRGWFLTHRHHVGYIPREIAAQVARSDLLNHVLVRPRTAWIGDSHTFRLYADLIGPKDKYKNYLKA